MASVVLSAISDERWGVLNFASCNKKMKQSRIFQGKNLRLVVSLSSKQVFDIEEQELVIFM